MKCPYCDQEHPDGAKFCPESGKMLQRNCPNCAKEVGTEIQFCPFCGLNFLNKFDGDDFRNTTHSFETKRTIPLPVLVLIVILGIVIIAFGVLYFIDNLPGKLERLVVLQEPTEFVEVKSEKDKNKVTETPKPILSELLAMNDETEKLVFSVQDHLDSDVFTDLITEIYSIKSNGEELTELFNDPDGVELFSELSILGFSNFSRDKEFIAVNSIEKEELIIIPLSGYNLIRSELDLNGRELFPLGFSPSGKYYSYSLIHEDVTDNSLIVIDILGNQVAEFRDYFFGIFTQNEEKMIVTKIDEIDIPVISYYLIDTSNWSEEWIGEFASLEIGFSSKITSDGKSILIPDEDGINLLSFDNKVSTQIYDAIGESYPITLIDNNSLLILEIIDGEIELWVFDLKNKSIRVIDKYISFTRMKNSFDNLSLGLIFSNNEKFILYTVGDKHNNVELKLSNLDEKKHSLIDLGGSYYSVNFSPSDNLIAYIKYLSSNEGGTLYVCDLDGNNKVRIDNDVWSFQFTNDGRNIVYSTVENVDLEKPVSEIFSINVNGEGKTSILGPYDGLITLLFNTK